MHNQSLSGKRSGFEMLMKALMLLSVGLTAALVLFLLIYVLGQGVPNITWELLSTKPSYLTERIGKLEFPEATLKRIMKINNEDKDDEYIEKNFAPSLEELTWHLIKEQLSEQLEIKVEQDDILESAKVVTRLQFAQYGMMNIPEDILLNYAKEMLKNKQQVENMVARTVESKIAQKVMEVATLNRKTVSLDEFNKMFAQEEETAE